MRLDPVYFWKLMLSRACPSIIAVKTISLALVKVRVTCNCWSCTYGITEWHNEFVLRLKTSQSYAKELNVNGLRTHIAEADRRLHLRVMYV